MISSARAGAFWDLTDYIADAANYPNLAAGQQSTYDNIAIDNSAVKLFRDVGFIEEYRTEEFILLKKQLNNKYVMAF